MKVNMSLFRSYLCLMISLTLFNEKIDVILHVIFIYLLYGASIQKVPDLNLGLDAITWILFEHLALTCTYCRMYRVWIYLPLKLNKSKLALDIFSSPYVVVLYSYYVVCSMHTYSFIFFNSNIYTP